MTATAQVPLAGRWEAVWPLPPPVDGPTIPVDVDPAHCGLPADYVVQDVREAMATWNGSGTTFRLVMGDVVTWNTLTVPTGRIVVRCEPTGTSGDWGHCRRRRTFPFYDLGPPFVIYSTLWSMSGALVEMNGLLTWGPRPDGGSYSQSLACALVHELGHAVGLDHVTDATTPSVMRHCGLTLRSGDLAAMQALYGRAREPYRVRVGA